MSRRHFSILLVAAIVVAAAIVLLVPRQVGEGAAPSGQVLLETVAEQINEVDRLVISGAGGQPVSTLTRGDTRWTISELHGYPADWEKLRTVLEDLARAKVLETKTSNPDYYQRLGVEDTESEDAGGLLLEVSTPDHSARLIAGDDARDLGGQFVRLAGQPQSVLIDRTLELSADPVEWADRSIIDISSGFVAELEVRHPDGDRILASKVSADDADFTLENMPDGRSLVSSWSLNSMASALSALRLEDVQPELTEKASEPVVFRLLTFDGLEVVAETFELDGQNWVKLNANYSNAAQEDTDVGEVDSAAPLDQAAAINATTHGWLFSIPQSKAELLTRRLEQLLKPEQDSAESGT